MDEPEADVSDVTIVVREPARRRAAHGATRNHPSLSVGFINRQLLLVVGAFDTEGRSIDTFEGGSLPPAAGAELSTFGRLRQATK